MANDVVDRIKDQLDIVEVVGSSVPLRQAGRNFKGLCPFHNEKTPSFVVFPDSQHFHCFGCGKSGDIFTFLMESEHLEFPDALRQLASRAGIELSRSTVRNPEKDSHRTNLLNQLESAAAFFSSILWDTRIGQPGRDLLTTRGIDRTTAERFRLGFAPDSFDRLRNHLQQRTGASEELLIEAGLLSTSDAGRSFDRFRNRLMFPIQNRRGSIIGFGARALGDAMPKYLNSPQTPVFNKSAELYALDKALPEIRKTRTLIVVEGYMDAIAAHQFGYTNVVASMGTALTAGQVDAVRQYLDRVFLALDADAAGQLASLRAIDTMRESFAETQATGVDAGNLLRFERVLDTEIRIVILEAGTDPDDLIRQDHQAWDDALTNAVPLVEYVLDIRLGTVEDTPAARASALQDVAVPLLREIKDPVIQRDYAAHVARLLNYRDTDVHAALQRRSRRESPTNLGGSDRPQASDPEKKLMELILVYPLQQAVRQGVLFEIDLDDLYDARNRTISSEILFHQGDRETALAELPLELQEYAEEITSQSVARSDLTAGMAAIEIRQAITRLAKNRHESRLRMAQHDLEDARAEGDPQAIRASLEQLAKIASRNARFNPGKSPYFKDLRTPVS